MLDHRINELFLGIVKYMGNQQSSKICLQNNTVIYYCIGFVCATSYWNSAALIQPVI